MNNNKSMSLLKLTSLPSYPFEQFCQLKLTGTTSLLSTTVTTGLISSAYQVTNTAIGDFATRFGSSFDSYRIVSCEFRVRPCTQASGLSTFWFDESSTTAPTGTSAQERILVVKSNNSSCTASSFSMRWQVRKLEDMSFLPIGTSSTVVTFKVYTDNTAFGSPTTVTQLWYLQPVLTVQFKGIKSA